MNETLQFVMQHGTMVLVAIVFVEQMGLPVPALPILVAFGVLAETGHLNLWIALGAAVSAAIGADWIWFTLGRYRGHRVLDWVCRIALEPESCVRQTEDFFIKHGAWSLVVAKFIPGLSTIAPPLAGIVGLSVPLFLFYDGLGALIWAGSSLSIGYVFSDHIEQAFFYAEQMTPTAALITVSAVIGFVSFKAMHRRRQLRRVPRITIAQLTKKLETDDPPLLIDIRPLTGAETGIPRALRMSLDELTHRHMELPRHRDLILYCGCPEDAASAQGTLLLRKKGFTRVWPLAGGIEAWNGSVVKSEDNAPVSETQIVAV